MNGINILLSTQRQNVNYKEAFTRDHIGKTLIFKLMFMFTAKYETKSNPYNYIRG